MNQTTLPTQYQEFIHQSRYARYIDAEHRRETWSETVARYFDFFENHVYRRCNYDINSVERARLEEAVLSLEVMPSMRCLMTAGKALERDEVAGYNCSYLAVDNPLAFDEALYILACGVGVGFSVEQESISKLPEVPRDFSPGPCLVVEDSKIGWAQALRFVISHLYAGLVPTWNLTQVRPKGARLKTFGGRASGPEPLDALLAFTVKTFQKAKGRRLSDLQCHDLMCKIGECIVVGGVRRSACISLSDLGSVAMREAKFGQWWQGAPQRALANNSAVYNSKPEMSVFMEEWHSLFVSKSGERGIFNREAAKVQAAKNGRRETNYEFGTNPCSEIILRPNQFCNLSEVVCRAGDDFVSLSRKIEIAAILGTIQSTLDGLRYLRSEWGENTAKERLLGVSLTGIMDCPFIRDCPPEILEELKAVAVKTNHIWAEKLRVPQSTAVTCVKPSGTVSALVDSASGIHSRHSPFYIRTVRGDNKDPLTQFLIASGVPFEKCVSKPETTTVFSFPLKSPDGAITRNDMSAVEQLEFWLRMQRHWCEHKPSVTISVREHEWMGVGAWVYDHFDEMSGVSFLPHSEHTYQQAPFQECDESVFSLAAAAMPVVDWSDLSLFETEDSTTGSQTLACSGNSCEMVDVE